MESIFNILTTFLLVAGAGLYLIRLRHERPPFAPYALILLVGFVGNWLGNNGGGIAAVAFLIAGAFLALHLAGEPYRDTPEKD